MRIFKDTSSLQRRRGQEENGRAIKEEEEEERKNEKKKKKEHEHRDSYRGQQGVLLFRGEKKKEEEEGGGLGGDVYDELYENDEALADFHSTTQFHPTAFKALGRCLEKLYVDLRSLRGRVVYPSVVTHLVSLPNFFYSWICSRQSLLFDPALHQKVLRYCAVYFSLFLTELTRLHGLKVVYADLRRLLISCPFISLSQGEAVLTLAIRHLNKHPLFDALPITVARGFHAVAQFDDVSWIGYHDVFDPDLDDLDGEEEEDEEEIEEDEEDERKEKRKKTRGRERRRRERALKEVLEDIRGGRRERERMREEMDEEDEGMNKEKKKKEDRIRDLSEEEEEEKSEEEEDMREGERRISISTSEEEEEDQDIDVFSSSFSSSSSVCDRLLFLSCLPAPLQAFLRSIIDQVVLSPLKSLLQEFYEKEDDLNPNPGEISDAPKALLTAPSSWVLSRLNDYVTDLWFNANDPQKNSEGVLGGGGASLHEISSSSSSSSLSNQDSNVLVRIHLLKSLQRQFQERQEEEEEEDEEEEDGWKKKKRKKKNRLTLFGHILLCIADPRYLLHRYGEEGEAGVNSRQANKPRERSEDFAFKQLEFPCRLGSRLRQEEGGGMNWRVEAVKVVVYLLSIDRGFLFNEKNESSSSSSATSTSTRTSFTFHEWIQAFDERRHDLFQLAGESEYKYLEWRSPLKKLLLRDVACSGCNLVLDLDVVAHTKNEEEILGNGEVVEFKTCACPRCGSAFSDEELEVHLYRTVEEKYYAYSAQDFPCSSCRAVNALYRRSKCRCGKALESRLHAQDWEDFIDTVQEFSVEMGYHKLQCYLAALQQAYLLLD
ncbi:dna polymerase family b protein [Cystoisospora suis]|uniref:DNA polymerase epsilon catalytic subunit n=1 Tax=Cystoisospora suis TaxID=483139 RepID=A0A2C6KRS9_9APIC|nr:dna polymerase family b protein [Cystoisospora suis]